MRVFLTGSSSCLAEPLLQHFRGADQIVGVTGIDIRKPPYEDNGKVRRKVMDMASPDLIGHMAGFDAVVHAGFAVMQGQLSAEAMRANNVDGSLNVFSAARANSIKKVINISSVSVYGSGENLSEDAPLSPSSSFQYAQHKAEIERIAAREFPEVIHLRCHLIFGRHAQPFLKAMATSRFVITPRKPYPAIQVVHESDVAAAVMKCLFTETSGAFNIATPQVTSLPDFVRDYDESARFVFPLPLQSVRFMVNCAKKFGSRDEFTWLDLIDTPLTVDCSRARQELGWRAGQTPETTRFTLRNHRSWL